MSKPLLARHHKTNWSRSTGPCCRRGSLLIWLDKVLAWFALHDGRQDRPTVFSDTATQFASGIRLCSNCRADRFGHANAAGWRDHRSSALLQMTSSDERPQTTKGPVNRLTGAAPGFEAFALSWFSQALDHELRP
jgi:hypothetical protein